jgi:FKBP-type peptidyl-prolyl cis-trans isomerase FkpA/FKBP-type peptidyl-prolyl cis-trans isomerase FklB
MKKLILLPIAVILLLSSCKTKYEKEMDLLQTYLDENNIDAEPTASGLYYIETLEGTGASPEYGDEVEVHYEGRLLSNDEIFDSSYERGEPGVFTVGTLITGWNEGLTYMKEGGKATMIIPSDIGYGENDYATIPGYSTLIFDVELIDVR